MIMMIQKLRMEIIILLITDYVKKSLRIKVREKKIKFNP